MGTTDSSIGTNSSIGTAASDTRVHRPIREPEGRRDQSVQTLPKEAGQLRDVGDGGEAARRVRGKVPGRIKLVLAPQLTVVLIRLN